MRGAGVVERLDQRLAHGVTGDHDGVDAFLLDQVPHLVRVELGHEHDFRADEAPAHDRPLGGPVHQGRDRQMGHGPVGSLLDHPTRVLYPRVGHGVGAAAEGVEDVLVAPYDALGHAGRAARVEDVDVVGRAGAEVTRRRLAGQGVLVADRVRGGVGDVGAVLDHDDVAQVGQVGQQRADQGENSRWWTSALRSALVRR